MASLNKVLLMGNMTRDPQLSYLPSQTAVVDFGMAMSHKFKKQDGSMAEDTCFVDCRMFGKRAETIQKYFKKGDPIFVEGRLRFETWEKDGKKNSRLRVSVENFEFMGRAGQKTGPAESSAETSPPDVEAPYGVGGGDEEIPF